MVNLNYYHIYKVTGEQQLALLAEFDALRQKQIVARMDWYKTQGADGIYMLAGSQTLAGLICKEPPSRIYWKELPDQKPCPEGYKFYCPIDRGIKYHKEAKKLKVFNSHDRALALNVPPGIKVKTEEGLLFMKAQSYDTTLIFPKSKEPTPTFEGCELQCLNLSIGE